MSDNHRYVKHRAWEEWVDPETGHTMRRFRPDYDERTSRPRNLSLWQRYQWWVFGGDPSKPCRCTDCGLYGDIWEPDCPRHGEKP